MTYYNNAVKINDYFNKLYFSSAVHPNMPNNAVILKGDSGASNHYIAPTDHNILTNVHHNSAINVQLPDTSTLTSTHSGLLTIPHVSSQATIAHVLPGLKNTSLLSLGQLADDGCVILLNKHHLQVFKNFEMILQGHRNKTDGLWDVPFPTNKPIIKPFPPKNMVQKVNIITPKQQPTKTLIQYLHATLFSPSKSTLLQAIRNGLLGGWPGLTCANVTKYLTETTATAKGHLDQHRMNLQSTNHQTSHNHLLSNDFSPPPEPTRTNQTIATIINQSKNSNAYFDLTGGFPYVSTRGYKYIFILYDYDSNSILAEPLRTRNAGELKQAWIKLHVKLQNSGFHPSTYIMDNEAANELKQAILKYKLSYQLTPPHIHRINAAERAIRTFKNHFLAGLATVDPSFPINEWDRLIPQAEITLNLLRQSRINPRLSAYSILHGHYDFNKHPMAPPGTKIVVHVKPAQRPSWGYHGDDGFYIGPALEHYRCVKCLMASTRHVRISDTVQFFPHHVAFPEIALTDRLRNAIDDIVSTLAAPEFIRNNPALQYDNETLLAIQVIANMLHRIVPKPPLPPMSTPVPIKVFSNSPQPIPMQKMAFVPRVSQTKVNRNQQAIGTTKTQGIAPNITGYNVSRDGCSTNTPNTPKDVISTTNPPQISAAVPRVRTKSRIPAHTKLKQRASSTIRVIPVARSIINRLLHIYNKQTGKKETLRSLLHNIKTRTIWSTAASNEYGRLLNGNDSGTKGTNTMQPVALHNIPKDCKITYGTMVCDHRPLKTEPNRCRLVVGGDKLTYENETAAPAANLLEAKLIINSAISTPNARFFTMDIKDFFLSSTMPKAEYMKMHISEIPDDIIDKYDMHNIKDNNGHVHFKIVKGMYGLKQAAILAYQQLKEHLEPYGYYPIPNTVGMWKHKTRPIQFCLCVDDFGVKYTNKQDADHLLETLKLKYKMTCDWSGSAYCGLTLNWDYTNRHVDISMPGYIKKTFTKTSTSKTKETGPCSTRMEQASLWTSYPTGHRRRYFATLTGLTNNTNPIHSWCVVILHPCGRSYNVSRAQRSILNTSITYGKNVAKMSSIVRLRLHTSQRYHPLSRQ